MIIQLYTPKGMVHINTDTVSNGELETLRLTRESLIELIPRDLVTEIDDLKARLEKLEKV